MSNPQDPKATPEQIAEAMAHQADVAEAERTGKPLPKPQQQQRPQQKPQQQAPRAAAPAAPKGPPVPPPADPESIDTIGVDTTEAVPSPDETQPATPQAMQQQQKPRPGVLSQMTDEDKGAAWAGSGAVMGAYVGGPVGALVGAGLGWLGSKIFGK